MPVYYGSDAPETLAGGAGAGARYGYDGAGTLYGGGGQDVLRFTQAPNATTNVDTIADFVTADDALEFSFAAFPALGGYGPLQPAAFVKGTAAQDDGDRLIYDQQNGLLYYDADGTGAAAQTLVARLSPGTGLSVADLFVV